MFNASVGLLLLVIGIISFLVGATKSLEVKDLRLFSLIMAGLWTCRLFFEFLWPVEIPFVIIPTPSPLFKVLMVMLLGILVLPVITGSIAAFAVGKQVENA